MEDFLSNVDWGATLQALLAWLGGLGLAGGAGLAAKRKYDQVKAVESEGISGAVGEEWKELAHARGDKIKDLEDTVKDLETRIARLEGAYEALEGLKSDDIARRVVEALKAQELLP